MKIKKYLWENRKEIRDKIGIGEDKGWQMDRSWQEEKRGLGGFLWEYYFGRDEK